MEFLHSCPKERWNILFSTDFCKVNLVMKTDSFPIPRVEDCIGRIGYTKYMSKLDLLKGYWQVPVTPRAKEIPSLVTPDGFFQYKVVPFGMKNAPATFQCMISKTTASFEGVKLTLTTSLCLITHGSSTWKDYVNYLED